MIQMRKWPQCPLPFSCHYVYFSPTLRFRYIFIIFFTTPILFRYYFYKKQPLYMKLLYSPLNINLSKSYSILFLTLFFLLHFVKYSDTIFFPQSLQILTPVLGHKSRNLYRIYPISPWYFFPDPLSLLPILIFHFL